MYGYRGQRVGGKKENPARPYKSLTLLSGRDLSIIKSSSESGGLSPLFDEDSVPVTRLAPIDTLLKTGEVLERTGVSHQVLYRYVTLGLIEAAEATQGGQRLFHPRVVDLIQQIRGLIETGYSLRHLKEIFFQEARVRRACAPDGR